MTVIIKNTYQTNLSSLCSQFILKVRFVLSKQGVLKNRYSWTLEEIDIRMLLWFLLFTSQPPLLEKFPNIEDFLTLKWKICLPDGL